MRAKGALESLLVRECSCIVMGDLAVTGQAANQLSRHESLRCVFQHDTMFILRFCFLSLFPLPVVSSV